MKKQMLMMASKVVKTVVNKDSSKTCVGFYFQPKRK